VYNPLPNIEPADPDVASVERETPTVPTAPAESTSDKGTIVDSIISGDTLMTKVHRAMGQLRDKAYRGASAAIQTPEDVCMSEVLKSDDPRATSPEMEAACQSEADGLVSRGAFRRRLRTSVPPNANVLGGRMVKVIKRVNTADAFAKARFVAQGNAARPRLSSSTTSRRCGRVPLRSSCPLASCSSSVSFPTTSTRRTSRAGALESGTFGCIRI